MTRSDLIPLAEQAIAELDMIEYHLNQAIKKCKMEKKMQQDKNGWIETGVGEGLTDGFGEG